VAVLPVPSAEQIIQLYEAGNLAVELAEYHLPAEDGSDTFLKRCVELHNNGDIDLVVVPGQPAFDAIDTHSFFTAQQFYCDIIPQLRANATALMACCRTLIERAGNDGAAHMPNGAFRQWCKRNLEKAAGVIRNAKAGDDLAMQFVTFALQGANDIETATEFVREYDDNRRLYGLSALGQMSFADGDSARQVVVVVEPFIVSGNDDAIRVNALSTAFDILRPFEDHALARRLVQSAAQSPGPQVLYGLARLLFQAHFSLDRETVGIALNALRAIDPQHRGTLSLVDCGLKRMVGTRNESQALDYLTETLREGTLTIEHFNSTSHKLNTDDPQRVYELVVRWLLSGSIALANNTGQFVRADKERIFNTSAQSLGLSPIQQLFLCRKAIGFLFIYPVACCSILVSVIRAADEDVKAHIGQLLFDPVLLSYSGAARNYLASLPSTDAAYGTVQNVLTRFKEFHSAIDDIGSIKELHPSERQLVAAHQRSHDQMREAHKEAEKQSIIRKLVHHSTILHGKRTLTYVVDPGGQKRAVAMDLQKHGAYVELPHLEKLDPVGLDYLLRMCMVEKPA
jgi:hypothetical protein